MTYSGFSYAIFVQWSILATEGNSYPIPPPIHILSAQTIILYTQTQCSFLTHTHYLLRGRVAISEIALLILLGVLLDPFSKLIFSSISFTVQACAKDLYKNASPIARYCTKHLGGVPTILIQAYSCMILFKLYSLKISIRLGLN